MKLGQFSAWISVDGVALTEFAMEYSPDGKEAFCWIPSEQDKVRDFRLDMTPSNVFYSNSA